MNSSTRSDIDALVSMLTSDRRWLRAKAIYFVEQHLSSSVDRVVIEEILNGLRRPGNHLGEDTQGLSGVLEQYLSGERPSLPAG